MTLVKVVWPNFQILLQQTYINIVHKSSMTKIVSQYFDNNQSPLCFLVCNLPCFSRKINKK